MKRLILLTVTLTTELFATVINVPTDQATIQAGMS